MPAQTAPSRGGTAPTGSKLRDSCLACSSSKVRCPREKPTCSRCARRRVTCEYLTSKRAGRKHDSSSNNNDPTTQASPHAENTPSYSSNPLPTPSGSSAPTTKGTSPPLATSISNNFLLTPQLVDSYIFPDLIAPTTSFEPFTNIISMGDQDLDSLLSPLTSVPGTFDSYDPDITLSGVLDFTAGMNNNNVEISDLTHNLGTSPEFNHINQQTNHPETKTNAAEDCTTAVDASCDCLVKITKLMKQLFPNPSPSKDTSATPVLLSAATIIERNRKSMEIVSSALSCSCSGDPHILAVTSHVVSKLLAWYVFAVQSASSTPNGASQDEVGSESSLMGMDDCAASSRMRSSSIMLTPPHSNQIIWEPECRDTDSGRAVARLVLGELHLAQRLVSDLVSKLKSKEPLQNITEMAELPLSNVNELLLLPFSDTVLDLLANNLRDQLKTLSVGIVNSLRDA
ncbi:hypothetical protein F5Y16DRAFT_392133 [Xylariaceae sp. FL0255]|nr:hypothetical protein F5Y16DRAFT_392133 [Xylariaceae sp. FL0255]